MKNPTDDETKPALPIAPYWLSAILLEDQTPPFAVFEVFGEFAKRAKTIGEVISSDAQASRSTQDLGEILFGLACEAQQFNELWWARAKEAQPSDEAVQEVVT